MSFTASIPDDPSASWMSASTRPGVLRATASTASVRGAGGAPDGVEHMIERDAGRHAGFKRPLPGGKGFERDAHVVVPCGLVARQGAGVPAHIGKVRRKAG